MVVCGIEQFLVNSACPLCFQRLFGIKQSLRAVPGFKFLNSSGLGFRFKVEGSSALGVEGLLGTGSERIRV